MTRRSAALVALVLIAWGGLFLTCFERGTEMRWVGLSIEAMRNPYLASQLFFEKMGHEVRVLEGPRELESGLPAGGTLIYPAPRLSLGRERTERLLEWVDSGGHLIVVSWTLADDGRGRSDPILDSLGVRQHVHDEVEDEDADTAPAPADPADSDESVDIDDAGDGSESGEPGFGALELLSGVSSGVDWDRSQSTRGTAPALEAFFDSRFYLELDDGSSVVDVLEGARGIHGARISKGGGFVTALTDDYLLRNGALRVADHAEILVRWARVGTKEPSSAPVWFLTEEKWPGFMGVLTKRAWAAGVAGVVLLLAWVLRSAWRFGPPLPDPQPVRRQLLEHVEVSGRYLWAHHRGTLLESCRAAALVQVRRRRPGWGSLAPDELARRLSEGLGVDANHALGTPPEDETPIPAAEFARAVQTLEDSNRAMTQTNQDRIDEAGRMAGRLRAEVAKAVVAHDNVIDELLIALIAGGHALLEGVPGIGKTLLARALAQAFGGSANRVQFTPDLMPADVVGHVLYDAQSGQMTLRKGPVFTHLLLADEINRAPAKTQAALLEVMQERQVTIEGDSLEVPAPFMTVATQNPLEMEGTYPLPEAQLDRFLLNIEVGYPEADEELRIIERVTGGRVGDGLPLDTVETVATPDDITRLQHAVTEVYVDPRVADYAVRIVRASRDRAGLAAGAGPRGGIALVRAARGRALLDGRTFATPDDVKSIAVPALRHRLMLAADAELEGRSAASIVRDLLEEVEAPRE